MGVIRLPHGPWRSLLVGKYEGKDVSLYQNPQRDILYVVVDRGEDGRARGLVVTVYRGFYVERGNVKQVLDHLSGSPVGVSKRWKGEIFQFLLVPGGIKYISLDPQELRDTVDEMEITLTRMEKSVLAIARALGITLRPLAVVPKNVAAILLVEPAAIAGLAPAGIPSVSEGGVMVLGLLKNGEVARDAPINFRRTIIYGQEGGRLKFFSVLIEEFLRNGINVLVATTRPEHYTALSSAGPKNELHTKLGLEPLGFSVKVLDTVVDLSLVPKRAFTYMCGVSPSTNTGEGIMGLLEANRDVETPTGLVERITKTDLISLRVGRVLRAVEDLKPEIFHKLAYNHFISLSSTGLGGAYILNTADQWGRASLTSYLAGIGEALKRRGKTENPRFIVFIEEGEKIVPREGDPISEDVVGVIEKYRDYGMGWVISTEKDIHIHPNLVSFTETKVGAVGMDDVGVRTLVKRPYRLTVRPMLSSLDT